VPTGFSATSAITTNGTIAISYDSAAKIPASSIASGTATAGYVPTAQSDGSLSYAVVSDPNAIVYAIALG
jgi:hypothetical protein